MRHLKLALLASAWLVWPGLAFGQTVERGSDVTVNPVARSGGMLLYPGGQYLRVERPLLQPGETATDLGVIHLHMPTRKELAAERNEAAADETATPKPVKRARAEPRPEPVPPPVQETRESKPVAQPPPVKQAKAAPKPQAKPVKQAKADSSPAATAPANGQPAYNPGFGFSEQGATGLNFGVPAPAPPGPQPSKMAKANPPPASIASPPAAEGATPGLTKRSVILFAPQAADPAQSALGAIKFLAGDLNVAMTSASARVQIQAYGGNRGDKSSDARRLSLKRALAIRQVLIDDGVPAGRIDVRAMGGADDSGPADRVDVYLRT